MAVSSESLNANKELVVRIVGRFDFSLHEDFKTAYEGKVQSGTRVVVDMAGGEYMDSSALGMWLLLRESVGEDDADVRLVGSRPEIRNILQVSNFDELFTIE